MGGSWDGKEAVSPASFLCASLCAQPTSTAPPELLLPHLRVQDALAAEHGVGELGGLAGGSAGGAVPVAARHGRVCRFKGAGQRGFQSKCCCERTGESGTSADRACIPVASTPADAVRAPCSPPSSPNMGLDGPAASLLPNMGFSAVPNCTTGGRALATGLGNEPERGRLAHGVVCKRLASWPAGRQAGRQAAKARSCATSLPHSRSAVSNSLWGAVGWGGVGGWISPPGS